ncbi:hypothetical protein Cgig2_029823 [Carnegiea gigantea]|uniref:ENTH domain-containing protein n=1 Tax=Carnegiea gigantea TaxID=171969 RepID=A0A9Q1GWU0_9CARY|nr:hypothetical protein Cgig2_029823 [Carnegiea gigantea]
MGRPKRMRDLLGVLKDKVSLIKASLILTTSSAAATSFQVAVLRATTHNPIDPPPEYVLDDVLALGCYHRPTASAVVDAILRRLHRTQSAFVALKCLLTLHHILRRGSPLLKAQFSHHHHHLLNLSNFRDNSDSDTVELSKWGRWAPDSLHYQRISMVYEVMKLVGEDYRITLREIFNRVTEFGEKVIEELSNEEAEELLSDLKRLEDCKEKVFLMFLNKKKSDGTWDSIAQLRRDVQAAKQRTESLSLVAFQGSGLARFDGPPPSAESRSVIPRGKRWLDVQWNHVAVNNGP